MKTRMIFGIGLAIRTILFHLGEQPLDPAQVGSFEWHVERLSRDKSSRHIGVQQAAGDADRPAARWCRPKP